MDGSVPGGRKTSRQTQEEVIRWMEGADSTGRHEGDRFGGWMAEIGRADTGKAGFVDGVMRGKNKKSSAAGKPHCK